MDMQNKGLSMVWLVKKSGELILILFVLSILVFSMSRLAPGDPLVSYYGSGVERMSTSEKEEAREKLGLNDPVVIQYKTWAKKAIQGDFGLSYKYKVPVGQVISQVALNTLLLSGTGFFLIFILALPLGAFTALREGKFLDKRITRFGIITGSIPVFWVSLVMILIFSVFLGILPASGAGPLGRGSFFSKLPYLVLPVGVLLISHLWYFGYITRNLYLEEMEKEYMLLHKIKGMPKNKILLSHGTRNIFPAYLTLMINSVPHLLGGSYIIEEVFSYPGLGKLAFESAKYHDYNLLMVIALITGAFVITLNILGDILSLIMNPSMGGEGRNYGRKRAV